VIQIEAIRIKEFRGIRELQIAPGRKSFVISGPNGSGKSGVVDAIEFGITGEISRLAGKGTLGLSVQRHGPHVDRRDDPSVAEVELTLYSPESKKTAVLTRNVKTAKSFGLNPDDPEIRAAVNETAQHPELILSRREIIRYILVEAGERSREIQALLKLDEIGDIRSVLATAKNRLSAAHSAATSSVGDANDALRRHLDLRALSAETILAAVNARRKILDLAEIKEWKADTSLNSGVLEGGARQAFNKQSALRDLAALRDSQARFAILGAKEIASILSDLSKLSADPNLLEAIVRRSFVERGLALVDGTTCPLCDKEWDNEEHLKQYLKEKLAKSREAEELQNRLLDNAAEIANQTQGIATLVGAVHLLAKSDGSEEFTSALSGWSLRLAALAKSLDTVEHILERRNELQNGWIGAPLSLESELDALIETLKVKPDQSASVAAQTFLTLAEDRLTACRSAERAMNRAATAEKAGKTIYKNYCDIAEKHLRALYEAVESDFSTYYQEINADDEGEFKAKFEPSEGKLDLEVDFHGRGMFPPAAYHSEGHQDGMGVCLYFALVKKLLGERFWFAVLDDVVMSVDRDHRKQFCKLLKTHFPSTQFIITTHDKVWTKQMQAEGLVGPTAGVVFHSWSVETGPIFEDISEVWDQIETDLAKNDVHAAAGRLRRHLEYISGELAGELGAKPTYRPDFSYDLGDLLPAVIGRQNELLKLAAKAANDWNDGPAKTKVEAMKTARSQALEAYGGENWVINKAIHYNAWEDFSKSEFSDVVAAFKALVLQLRCPKPECDSWLYVTPKKGDPEVLRCRCMGVSLNLKAR
jgi:recombinational DNA repair ATPase RecF